MGFNEGIIDKGISLYKFFFRFVSFLRIFFRNFGVAFFNFWFRLGFFFIFQKYRISFQILKQHILKNLENIISQGNTIKHLKILHNKLSFLEISKIP